MHVSACWAAVLQAELRNDAQCVELPVLMREQVDVGVRLADELPVGLSEVYHVQGALYPGACPGKLQQQSTACS